MKTFFFLSALCTLLISAGDCSSKKDENGEKYRGRLEIKGICMNYTIKLLEGSIDTSRIQANWKDESSGKSYTNVFRLGDVCNFPATIKEGDEFYFVLDTEPAGGCAVCEAYYPTPQRSLNIKVLDNK
jgi:hypothetical protein